MALVGTGALAPVPAVASVHPDTTAALTSAATRLVETSLLPELVETIPGLGTNPGLLLGLHEPFGALAGISELSDIDTLDGEGFTFDNVVIEEGDVLEGSFDLAANRSITAPIMLVEDEVQLLGDDVPVTVSMPPTTISFEYDEARGGGDAFALVDLPTLTLTVAIDETVNVPVQFGFADAAATGSVVLDTAVGVTPADPDGDGRLTSSEVATLAAEDLVQLDFPAADDGSDDLAIDLDLVADVYGIEFEGNVTVTDDDLFGDPSATVDFEAVGDNPIDLLTNVGPDLAITALSQYLSGYGLAMIGGDVRIPLLEDGVLIPGDLGDLDDADFDRVFDAVAPLVDYIEPRSAGQIVCGTTTTAPEGSDEDGIPAGDVRMLESGQEVHCRAYTAEEGDAVTWNFTNATPVDPADADDVETVGIEPTRNVTVTMDADGELGVSLEYTPEGASEAITILPRPDTIQELLGELADAGLIPTAGGDPVFGYDPQIEAFTFPISTTVDAFERTGSANAGNSLVAESGLTGLTASATSNVDITVGPIDAAMTLGLIVTDDVADITSVARDEDEDERGPGDRFFVKTSGPVLTVEDVALSGNIGLQGRLGFLEVSADGTATLAQPEDGPALEVGLTDPIGVTVGGNTDADATLLRDLLRQGPGDSISGAVDLALSADLEVTSSAAGMDVSGTATIAWDLAEESPSVDLDGDFEGELLPFDRADEFTYVDDPDNDDPAVFTTTGTRLLDIPGLVGAYLVDDDGNRCQITAVLSDTSLRCTDLQSEDEPPPIEFQAGQEYTVRGNTLSHLTEILDAFDQLVAYLETVAGEQRMREPLPIVGIAPGDLVEQADELRQMLDEFRGVQAARIQCAVQGASGADIRALELSPGDEATLECGARGSIDDARDVRWRVAGRFGDAEWVTADPSTVGTEPDTVELSVTAPAAGDADFDLPTDTDGFVVLGDEYTIEVEWRDRNGERRAALPPRTPRSLQGLAEQITDVLGLPQDALAFALGNSPTLRIDLTYGICSEAAPADLGDDCDGMPEGPAPELDLNAELGGDLGFATLGTAGDPDIRYGILGQFDLGIPLDGDEPVLYGSTGLRSRLQVDGDGIGVDVNIGPARGVLGAGGPVIQGTADGPEEDEEEGGSEDGTLVDRDVDLGDVPLGAVVERTSDGGQCFVTAVADADEITCDLDWSPGDAYRIGAQDRLEAAIAFDVEVTDTTDGDSVVSDGDSVAVSDAGVAFTDLDGFLAGDADCGGIDATNSDDVVTDGDGDDDSDLTGIACGRLSVALQIGGDDIFLGEVGLDLDAGGLTVWIPDNLLDRLEDALDFGLILRALPPMLKTVEQELRSFARSGIPAAIGDPLQTGADGIEEIRGSVESVIDTFGDELDAATDPDELEDLLADELASLLGELVDEDDIDVTAYCGTDPCDGDGIADVTALEAELSFGESLNAGTGINLGMEGLPLSVETGVEASAAWSVAFGIGVSVEDGPYLTIDSDEPEADVGAEVTLSSDGDCASFSLAASLDVGDYDTGRCLQGQLGFIFLQAVDSVDNPTGVDASVGLDLVPASGDRLTLPELLALDFDVTVDDSNLGEVNVDLAFRTGLGVPNTPDLPSVLGTFQMSWSASDDFEIGFDNLHLDVGTFLATFLDPIVGEIRHITGPLQPIIDVIMAPIPVVTDLAELVGGDPITMVSVLEDATGADLSLVRAVAAFINFINEVGDLGDDDGFQLPLGGLVDGGREPGSFDVDTVAAATAVSPDDAGKLLDRADMERGTGLTADIASDTGLSDATEAEGRPATFGVPGLSFPFLDDASQVFGILVGRDAVVVRWDAGTLEAAAGLSYDFGPIMVGPIPITITIGGEIGVEGRFAIGYDTSGIRRQLDGGSGVALFDGIFIDDLDAAGNDVDEITFFGRVFAGAAVDLVIVSAGAAGGIELTFALNLDDRPDPDGKLRIEEIVDKLSNPICLFEVSGRIEAFLEAFVEIDLFLTSKRYSLELVRITLLEWSDACEPPAPVLADEDDGVLYLNVGERRHQRNVNENVADEKIEVRQIGDGKVRVTAFGAENVFEGVDLIVADGGIGTDELLFLPGSPEETADDEDIPFDIPVVVSGGPGNDIIRTGDAPDRILGDAPVESGTWESIGYDAFPTEGGSDEDLEHGNDQVNAGAGDDVVTGDGGNDPVDGQLGDDTILGGDGNDRLSGGPGSDRVLGEAGDDQLQGGPIEQPEAGEDPNDDDAIAGGPDADTVSGDFGDDVLFGDDAASGFFTVDEDSQRHTFSAPDSDTWRGWCDDSGDDDGIDIITGIDGADWIVGGGAGDKIDAGVGDDHACGSDGDDEIHGGDGNDELRGNDHDDDLFGDNGGDLVRGGNGTDLLEGGPGGDDLFGDGGPDLVDGGTGHDIVVGDTGSVTVDTPTRAPGPGGTLDADRVLELASQVVRDSASDGARRADCDRDSGIGHSDCLTGGSGSDALFGGSDGDIVRGDAGVDLLEGNDGADLMRGGIEPDLLFGNGGGDELFGDSGEDELYGDRPIANWQDDQPAGAAADDLFGGPDADHIEGDGGNDDAFGGADADHIEGNDGADTLFGQGGDDDVIGGSDRAGEPDDGEALVSGGPGVDVIAGDNADIGDGGIVGGRTVQLLDPTIGGGDHLEGDAGTDFLFGGPAGDTVFGDHGANAPFSGVPDDDYAEGNDGADTIHGEAGDDDLIGGSSAADGSVTADRVGTGAADGGETLVTGGDGRDWVAGDNARMNRVLLGAPDYPNDDADDFEPIVLFDLSRADAVATGGAYGADTLRGDNGSDLLFGQGGNDTINGNGGDDYVEGNDGDDALHGDEGDDDLVGGGSAADGVVDRDRDGNTLHDGGETAISGGDGVDWIAGDNAFMNRVLFGDADTPIQLFDVNSGDTDVSGGDTIAGDGGDDVVFGQGNGTQTGQSDPPDGIDNDGDGATDEDVPWHGDVIDGVDGDDYIEGNHGADLILGGAGNDDVAGGGSAIDGVIDDDRVGDGLLDARDTVHGGGGDDVVGGDNVRILPATEGPLWLTDPRHVTLFDVNDLTPAFSGGDYVSGGDGDDVVFGQGNGDQDSGQADPLDGYDNDLDGREDGSPPDDRDAYDCADGADNDGDAAADEADPECASRIDEDQPWDGDILHGNAGHDYVEGNHGADWVFGGEGQDDAVGGGSAIDGVIDADRTGVGLADGSDVIHGDADHDVLAGDNAVIDRRVNGANWARIPGAGGTFDLVRRDVAMAESPEESGRFANDHLRGGTGHDHLYGQQGHDLLEGGEDDDTVVGDLGRIESQVEDGGRTAHIAPRQPFVEDDIFAAGTLTNVTTLFAQRTGDGVEGDDVMLGGPGHDDLHGGPGNDIMNGDRYDNPPDPDLIELREGEFVWDDPAVGLEPFPDEDALFGGYGNDVMWGGRDPDHLYGGHGDDFLDVRPRPATEDRPADPPSWFTWVRVQDDAGNDSQEHYQDSDVLYGGWGTDALQANLADTGPNDGDRLFDWAGAYNIYYVCPPVYGDWVITRSLAPDLLRFFEDLAGGDGLFDVSTSGSSGFDELGLVYNRDVRHNSNPAHPETPGHFYCGDGTEDP